MRPVLTLALAAICLALVSTGLAHAHGDPISVGVSKKPDGPFDEFLSSKVNEGKSKLFYFKVETSLPESVRFSDVSFGDSSGRYKVKWFKGKGDEGKNVTRKVKRKGGLAYDNSGASFLTAKVARTQGGGSGYCLIALAEIGDANEDEAAYTGLDGESCVMR